LAAVVAAAGLEGGGAGCENNIEEMNYELAERLRDKGLPQSGEGS
jgi:hypothetical protein